MILVKQDEYFRIMGFGSLRPFLESNEFILPIFTFPMVKLADGSYGYSNRIVNSDGVVVYAGYPELTQITSIHIDDKQYVNPDTLVLSGTQGETGQPAFTFLQSRTVGHIYTTEQIEAMTTAQIRAISRYAMDAEDVENFILANGWLSGTRI